MSSAPDRVLAALADPTRRGLFEKLSSHGEQNVQALTGHARISQPAVSKHLAVLKRAGLVRARRSGRETHYRAHPDGLAPLVDWMSSYAVFWHGRLDALEDLLNRMKP
jgi:DNA-binding transcriptional ArsR family regulator